jgi:prolyl 4-hydroxylase
VVRYDLYGRYNEHHDFFEVNDPLYEKEMREGGQRIKTVLIYLNDDFEGGQTYFQRLGRTITPKKLMMIIWDNVLEDGSVNLDSLHTGVVVDSGQKYIALTLIREREHRKFLL